MSGQMPEPGFVEGGDDLLVNNRSGDAAEMSDSLLLENWVPLPGFDFSKGVVGHENDVVTEATTSETDNFSGDAEMDVIRRIF